MKKFLSLFCLSLMLTICSKAQISDFTTDSCFTISSLETHFVNVTNPLYTTEFGLHMGLNEVIRFDLRTINMGPDDADFHNSLDTTHDYHSAHGHTHLYGWLTVYLLDECGNIVGRMSKIGWGLCDGANIMQAMLNGNVNCFRDWITQYGTPDYSLDQYGNFDCDENMGLSAGQWDDYLKGLLGNSFSIDSTRNGVYKMVFQFDFSRYFNQGANTFPDGFAHNVTLSGEYPGNPLNPRTLTVGGVMNECCDATNPDPSAITITGNVVNWDSTGACDFNDLEILIWHEKRNRQPEYRIAQVIPITTETSFVHSNKLGSRELQQYARQVFITEQGEEDWEFNGGSFRYRYRIGNTIF